MTSPPRTIEIFSAGCPVCDRVIEEVRAAACSSCEVDVLEMDDPGVEARARELGVASLPAVAVDGELAGCCQGSGPDLEVLRQAGLGRPLD